MAKKIKGKAGNSKIAKGDFIKQNSTYGLIFGMAEDQADEMGRPVFSNLGNYQDKYTSETWVYAGVKAVAQDISGVPLRIYRKKKVNGEEVKEEIPDHPFLELLKKPNDIRDGREFKEAVVAYPELTGNAYVFMDEMTGRIPGKMYVMRSNLVEIVKGGQKIKGYVYHVDGRQQPRNSDEIDMMKYFNPNDEFYGLSSIAASRMAIQSNEKSRDHNAAFFKNGARTSGAFQTEARLGEVEYKRLLLQIKENYEGNKNAFKPIILEKGLNYKEIGVAPKDMDFIKSRGMSREEILACIGVPPFRVGVLEHANYANSKEQMIAYWMNTLIPKMVGYQQFWQRILDRWEDDTFIEYDLSKVVALRPDETIRMENVKGYALIGFPLNVLIDWFDLPVGKRDEWINGRMPINMVEVFPPGQEEPEEEPEEDEDDKGKKLTKKEKAKKKKEKEDDEKKKFEKLINRKREDYVRSDVFVKAVTKFEDLLIIILRKYFDKQKKEVLNNLERQKEIIMEESLAGDYNFYSVERYKRKDKDGSHKIKSKKKLSIEDIMFNEKDAIGSYQKDVRPVHREALQSEGKAELARLGLAINFNIEDPRVLDFLKKYGLDEAKLINGVTKKKLRNALIEGVRQGESIDKIANRIKLIYREANRVRALRIARTEIVTASNFGALESYKQAGKVVKGWEWLTAKDELVCEICLGLDGSEYNIGEGEHPPAHPNCRCAVLPILRK